jgi:hypothetical protein
VLPYLLVRALTPGDRGRRALWPPTPCWESPDILLIDASWTGPFDPARLVATPVSGRSYRVFVHVWNLGLVPAVGVHVRAWWLRPGFFGGQDTGGAANPPAEIGGAWVDLADRTDANCHRPVEMDGSWAIPSDATGHECLLASASCPADTWDGRWTANDDRHVAQRNLTVLSGDQDVLPLFRALLRALPPDAAVHVTHGGQAAGPLLEAVAGGRVPAPTASDPDRTVDVAPMPLEGLSVGVEVGQERHIALAVTDSSRDVRIIVPSDRVVALFAEQGWPDPFTDLPSLPRRILSLPADVLAALQFRPDLAVLGALLNVGQVSAGAVAIALRRPAGPQHLLRFTATDLDGHVLGGYSLVVM